MSRTPLPLVPLLVALAGCATLLPRETVREETRVTLAFPADTEPGVAYRWVQVDGPAVEIADADTGEASFVAPQATENYRLLFTRLSEEGGEARSRQFGVYVVARDDPPVVEAGPTVQAGEGEVVELVGTATDPERAELAFAWRQVAGPRVPLEAADAPRLRVRTPPVVARTWLRFELAASDGVNPPSRDEVTVVVDPVDSPPELSVVPEVHCREGQRVVLEARGVDPEGAELAYVWSPRAGAPRLQLDDESGPRPSFVAPLCPTGVDSYTFTFDVTASDGANFSRTERVVVTVVAAEGVPVAEAGEDLRVKEGERVRLLGRASHPENRALSFAWRQTEGSVPLVLEEADTLTPYFAAPRVPEGKRAIDAVLELTVSDGEHRARDRVAVLVEPAFSPRLKRTPLRPGQIDPLLGHEDGVLSRWIRARLAPPEDGRGFHAAGTAALEARFARSSGAITCDLPPGHWRLEGVLTLQAVDTSSRADPPGDGRGALLRFETAEGEAAAFGIATLGQRLGVQVHSLELDPHSGDWHLFPETLQVLEECAPGDELVFHVTWKDLTLSFQWGDSQAAVAEAPAHTVELSRAPELLTLSVERARVVVGELRLVGTTL